MSSSPTTLPLYSEIDSSYSPLLSPRPAYYEGITYSLSTTVESKKYNANVVGKYSKLVGDQKYKYEKDMLQVESKREKEEVCMYHLLKWGYHNIYNNGYLKYKNYKVGFSVDKKNNSKLENEYSMYMSYYSKYITSTIVPSFTKTPASISLVTKYNDITLGTLLNMNKDISFIGNMKYNDLILGANVISRNLLKSRFNTFTFDVARLNNDNGFGVRFITDSNLSSSLLFGTSYKYGDNDVSIKFSNDFSSRIGVSREINDNLTLKLKGDYIAPTKVYRFGVDVDYNAKVEID